MTPARVGIIGGYGPLTSAIFCQKLVEHAQRMDQSNAPSFAMESMPISMDDARLCIAGDEPATRRLVQLANQGMVRLGALGVRSLAFPCNSVHALADEFAVPAGVDFLHIADVCTARLRDIGARKIGFLASGMTVRAGFYQQRFTKSDLTVLPPAQAIQDGLNAAIASYVRTGVVTAADRTACLAALSDVCDQGAEVIALCCTDISGMLTAAAVQAPRTVVDSMEVLAEECARRSVITAQ